MERVAALSHLSWFDIHVNKCLRINGLAPWYRPGVSAYPTYAQTSRRIWIALGRFHRRSHHG